MPKKEVIVIFVPWFQEAKKDDLWLGHRMQQGDIVMTFANGG